jgi:tRNA(Ile)-lysidine synthase
MDLTHLLLALKGESRLFPQGGPVVVGVSGGPDSLCLLDGLRQLDYGVIAAHFDHMLRADSAEDARKVEAIARQMKVPFCLGQADVRGLAAQESLSIEEAARKARYRYLFQAARAHQAQAVAVAHTADDQVETVLMHLLRGSGLNGLKGMTPRAVLPEWDEQIPLVRPLLAVWREETEAWCREHELPALHDPSNQETIYFRNRLRHELIPYLQGYNPNIKEGVWRMARTLGADQEVLEAQLDLAWQRCWLEDASGWVSLSLAGIQDLAVGLQRGVLRRAIGRLRPGLRDIDYEVIERGLAWMRAPQAAGWLDLAAGLQLRVEWGRVYVCENYALPVDESWPQVAAGKLLFLEVPGKIDLDNGWALQADWEQPGEAERRPQSYLAGDGVGRLELDAWLDGERLRLPLQVRGLRPGERLAPLGMDGHSLKLSDFYTNRKLPQRAREGWPLVLSGEEVAWAAGLRMSERYKVGPETRRLVRLRLVKEESL